MQSKQCVVNSALFGRNHDAKDADRIHGYFGLQLFIHDGHWYFRLWPRRANVYKDWKLDFDWRFEPFSELATKPELIKPAGHA